MNCFVRALFFIIFCFIYSNSFAQQNVFSWTDNKTNLHWRIDTSSHLLRQETKTDHWENAGLVKMVNVNFSELPANLLTNSFLSDDPDKRYFTVMGTGQVYQFSKSKLTLTRLDKTYFRGYNFSSSQFIRKDTIYSFGGSGFWQFNATLTYYDWGHQEWEWLQAKNEGPQVINSYFSGYDPKTDVFYSALNPYGNEYGQSKPTRDKRVFALNLKSKKWQLLGLVDENETKNTDEAIVWSGRYFFQCNDSFLLIIDPEENKVFEYNDGKSIFNSILDINDKTLTTKYLKFNNKFIRESFTIQNILRDAKYIGPFYIGQSISRRRHYILGFGIVILMGLMYFLRKRKLIFPFKNLKEKPSVLTDLEMTVLSDLISKGRNGTLNTIELNSILNIDGKSQDNQRKIRADFIAEINQKIEAKYNINNCIDRKPSKDDKRITLYYLTDKGFNLFGKHSLTIK